MVVRYYKLTGAASYWATLPVAGSRKFTEQGGPYAFEHPLDQEFLASHQSFDETDAGGTSLAPPPPPDAGTLSYRSMVDPQDPAKGMKKVGPGPAPKPAPEPPQSLSEDTEEVTADNYSGLPLWKLQKYAKDNGLETHRAKKKQLAVLEEHFAASVE